jgi:hypothetical protein
MILIFQSWLTSLGDQMKCELCNQIATEKHHVSYYPEMTIPVCGFHGDEIHKNPKEYGHLIQYPNGDGHYFYEQERRVNGFLFRLARERREYWRNQKR